MKRHIKATLAVVGIFSMTLAAYVPAMQAGFIWDDDDYVTENEVIQDVGGLKRIWFEPGATTQYYPLVYTTFWIEHQIWGFKAMGYHIVNALLHAAAAVMLWRVLLLLRIPGAWFAAAVFAVHPVCVESVAWITERKNVLSATLYFSSALVYMKFALFDGADNRRPWWLLATSFALFAGALLSKTVTGTLPAALLVLAIWKCRKLTWAQVVPLAVMMVAGAAMGIYTAHMEKVDVGAEGADWQLSLVERFLVAGRILWFYAAKLVAPLKLTFIYPRWDIDDRIWWQYLYPIAALAVPVGLWLARKKIGTGALVATLLFAGTLMPALGFADVYAFRFSYVADHWVYLAVPSLVAMLSAVGASLLGRTRLTARLKIPLAVVILAALGALTWQQTKIYKDQPTLWTDTLEKNPKAWLAMNNLGCLVRDEGRTEEAIEFFDRCIEIKPDLGSARYNRANAYKALGKVQLALQGFNDAIRVRPGFPEAYVQRGLILGESGNWQQAIADYSKAIRMKTDYAEAYRNRGVAYAKTGRVEQAVKDFSTSIKLAPEVPETRKNRGLAFVEMRQYSQAIADYDKAIELKQDYEEAYCNRGIAYAQTGQMARALQDFDKAIELDSSYGDAYHNRGVAYWKMGKLDQAIQSYRKAIELAPENARFHSSLALALAAGGKLDEAAIGFRNAIEIAPGYADAHYKLAMVLRDLGKGQQAIAEFRRTLELRPNWPDPMNNLARMLASDNSEQVRDGSEAIRLAEKACELTGQRDPTVLDTLAAAYAETGQFAKAIETAEKAHEIAIAAGATSMVEGIRERIGLYKAGQPYRE